jgi:hypothetical protein
LTVAQKQELFSRLLPRLIDYAHARGFEVRLRDLWRTQYQADENARLGVGSKNSLHLLGLAIDFYIRKRGGGILWSTERYRELGEFWERLHPLCYWGGRTDKPNDRLRNDGGHFSITHGGVQ